MPRAIQKIHIICTDMKEFLYFIVGFVILSIVLESWIRQTVKSWFEENYKDRIDDLEYRLDEIEQDTQANDLDEEEFT